MTKGANKTPKNNRQDEKGEKALGNPKDAIPSGIPRAKGWGEAEKALRRERLVSYRIGGKTEKELSSKIEKLPQPGLYGRGSDLYRRKER